MQSLRATPVILGLALLATLSSAEDWPTYMGDNARSGVSAEEPSLPLAQHWVHRPIAPPDPAWADPQSVAVEGVLELPKVKFDDAFHATAADGAVFFGSSADNQVHCLDLATGRERWAFTTGGPVRLAPTVVDGRVYVGSDDGIAYCLDAEDGSVVWQFAGAPGADRVLGHGKMISVWPLRTGVLVDGGLAYFTAGIFPGERVYLYCVNAETGELVWQNDRVSDRTTGQDGFSPQGYLLASDKSLFIPSGRALPARFDRATGEFIYQRNYSRWSEGPLGGTWALLVGDAFYAGTEQIAGYDEETGTLGFAYYPDARRLLVTEQIAYVLRETGIEAQDQAGYPEISRALRALGKRRDALNQAKPEDLETQLAALDEEETTLRDRLGEGNNWSFGAMGLASMIVAGETLFAGGQGSVVAVDRRSGEQAWTAPVNGSAKGLAFADGRLLVSTDTGDVYCFGTGEAPAGGGVHETEPEPYPPDRYGIFARFGMAAASIVEKSGADRGYALVLGCGNGRLAYELAQRTELMIYCIDPDPEVVAAAREALSKAGVYGTRVCVDVGDLDNLPYADYFANLVVSSDLVLGAEVRGSAAEALRCLKPSGGVLVVGGPRRPARIEQVDGRELLAWATEGGMEATLSEEDGTWVSYARGALEGGGSWTHQYGTPGNTASSTDTLVECPLGLLWYGEPGPDKVVNRHAGAAAPLSIDGRVYLQGENLIMCFDAYNGVMHWEREIPGAYRVAMVREASNLACSESGLFVATGQECELLDAATGETIARYGLVPGAGGGAWGFLAVADGTLYGSRGAAGQFGQAVFAYDIDSGDLKWVHEGQRIRNNTIAIDGGRLFLADDGSDAQLRREALAEQIAELVEAREITEEEALQELASADVRKVMALDADTGEPLWVRPIDLTDCGGGVLSAMAAEGTVVFCGAHANGHYWPQFLGGEYGSRRITVLSAQDGATLWSKPIGYRIRPLIIGETIFAEPWAFDLKTGAQRTRTHPVSGREEIWEFERPGHHCGTISGSPNVLLFRSGSAAYYDLVSDHGTEHWGGQRSGCWINQIPANGLVIMPEASSGCVCLFSIHCTTVFKPRTTNKAWALYDAPGDLTPVRNLNINLGAPGDRRDGNGDLWLSYPRPGGRMLLRFELGVSHTQGGGYFAEAAETFDVEGGTPWIHASGVRGLTRCRVPLMSAGDGGGEYTVRLAFADTENTEPGERVFDIKIQGETVEEGFDIIAAAGGPARAVVREFPGIIVEDDLLIDLVPKGDDPTGAAAPVLNGISVERERMLRVGLGAPEFRVSDLQPEQVANVRIANRTDEAFRGTLRIAAPEGFSVTPTEATIELDADSAQVVPIRLEVAAKGERADLEVGVELLRADGEPEASVKAALEYLGPRGRLVIPVAEDAHVSNGSPDSNYGTAATLFVDGGAQEFGDESYSIAYLRFPLQIPGKAVSVKLRLRVPPNDGAQSGNSGRICLLEEPWGEGKVTFANRPEPGDEIGMLGAVTRDMWEERVLDVDLAGRDELCLVLDPTGNDGASYHSKDGESAPELVIEYEPE